MRVKVKAYRAIGKQEVVYHDRADCPIGSQIYSDHLAAGDGGRRRCPVCAALDRDDVARSE